MITWKIKYKINGIKNIEENENNKKVAIEKYLYHTHSFDVSELKIFKNDKDYTETLNKFLYK